MELELIILECRVPPCALVIAELDPAPLFESHSTPLFLAASNVQVDVFDYLNEKQPTVQATTAGWLHVHAAASSGNLEFIDRLEDQPKIYAETTTGRLAIHIAASNGHVSAVEDYIDLGIPVDVGCRDPNAPSDSSAGKPFTPLYLVVGSGSKSLVTLLLQKGADIGILSYNNQSLLHAAAQVGHRDIIARESGSIRGRCGQEDSAHVGSEHRPNKLLSSTFKQRIRKSQ